MKLVTLLPALALGTHSFSVPASALPAIVPRFAINDFLALVSNLFPVNVALDAAQNIISAADQVLASVEGFETTREDLNDGVCGDVLVIFARGTDEPGNVGALVGPALFQALENALGSEHTLAVQGVDNYGATVKEYLLGGDIEGSKEMASLVTQSSTECPSSKIVLSGYSQGGQLVHNAASLLPAAAMQAVSSVVIFGDPGHTQSVSNADTSKVLIICHVNDDICQGGDIIVYEHLTYAKDADTAAAFIVSKSGL